MKLEVYLNKDRDSKSFTELNGVMEKILSRL